MSLVLKKLALTAAVATLVAACAPEKPSDKRDLRRQASAEESREATNLEQQPVVVVDGEEISLGEFERRLQELPEYARVRYSSIEQKKEYLNSVAQFEVMADVAESKGLGDADAVYFAMKDALAERLLDEVVRQNVEMDAIDQDAVRRYYEAHRDEYRSPAARRVALLEVETRAMAERLRQRLLDKRPEEREERINAFRGAAATYSIDRAAAREGGDIGFVPAPDADPERPRVAEAVFALSEPGEISPVIDLEDGFGLAIFFEERAASQTSLDEAAREIRQTLYEAEREKFRRQFVAKLREGAEIETFSEVVDDVEPPGEPGPRRVEDVPTRTEPAFEQGRAERD